jgi:hypothetical protein
MLLNVARLPGLPVRVVDCDIAGQGLLHVAHDHGANATLVDGPLTLTMVCHPDHRRARN